MAILRTTDLRSQTCCLTGHQDVAPWEEPKILTKLRYKVDALVWHDYRYFGVGGARGFDRLAAEYLLNLRDRDKPRIRIISVLPYPGYMEGWSEEDVSSQERILRSFRHIRYGQHFRS